MHENQMLQKCSLPALEYDYDALEPVISAEIMQIHHTKHHQAYVNNYNLAIEKYHEAEARQDIEAMISIQQQIKFNGGGHINHSIFWTNLAPKSKGGGQAPTGELALAIQAEFGSLEKFIEQFNALALGIQGSGWAWLGYNKSKKRLMITSCANQDPLSTQNLIPLLGIDVWEHAYYLQYKNVRADYLKSIWQIINWQNVFQRFEAARNS